MNEPKFGEWIYTEDAMPEEDESKGSDLVLVLIKARHGIVYDLDSTTNGEWVESRKSDVYAWTPLPDEVEKRKKGEFKMKTTKEIMRDEHMKRILEQDRKIKAFLEKESKVMSDLLLDLAKDCLEGKVAEPPLTKEVLEEIAPEMLPLWYAEDEEELPDPMEVFRKAVDATNNGEKATWSDCLDEVKNGIKETLESVMDGEKVEYIRKEDALKPIKDRRKELLQSTEYDQLLQMVKLEHEIESLPTVEIEEGREEE